MTPRPHFLLAPVPQQQPSPARLTVIAERAHGTVHAPSLLALDDGRLQCFWFEGKIEAGMDIRIRSALKDGAVWSNPIDLFDAPSLGKELGRGIRTIGNPVPFRHPSGEYWLIFPTVTIGGWAGSTLNLKRSRDGMNWGPARRLYASPFLNLSNVAKAPPLALSDGSIALPAYHEMMGGFGEMLFISPEGDIIDKARMGARGVSAIQPWVLPLSETRAVALCRDYGRKVQRIWRTETLDAGRSWTAVTPLAVKNTDNPVALLRLQSDMIGMISNDSDVDPRITRLSVSSDAGLTFQRRAILFDGRGDDSMDRYFFLLPAADGSVHLVNTRVLKSGLRQILHCCFSRQAFFESENDHVF